jgi:hypothetical protein
MLRFADFMLRSTLAEGSIDVECTGAADIVGCSVSATHVSR